jgi:hypothetical protein
LRSHILAAAAFQHQIDSQRLTIHLFEVDGGEVVPAQVVAGIAPGERIHRVGAQVGAPGGFCYRGFDLSAQLARAPAFGVVDVKDGCAGVLADGRRIGARQLHILQDGFQRAARRRTGGFFFHRLA